MKGGDFMKLIQKFKESKVFRIVSSVFVSAMIACMFCLNCFAAEVDAGSAPDLGTTLQTSLNDMVSNLISYVGIALPIALSVVGAFFAIKKVVAFFRSVANKG